MPSPSFVSVIIPCYNFGRFLSDALESVLAQTYPYWECIVMDDGSTDNTKEVAYRYIQQDPRFKYIFQSNSGVSSARNKALKEAAGKYVQLLDADDLLEKDKFQLQVAFLEAHPDTDLVYSSMIVFKEDNKNYRTNPQLMLNKKPVSGSGEALLNSLLDDNLFLPGCALFKKSMYEDVGGLSEDLQGNEDWHFYYRAALLSKVFYHDNRTGTRLLVRSHGNNTSNNRYKMWINIIKARKELMQETEQLFRHSPSPFSNNFIHKAGTTHKALLNRDGARLNLFYGNVFTGSVNAIKHAYYSKNPWFAFYDGAYWIKERLKRKLKYK